MSSGRARGAADRGAERRPVRRADVRRSPDPLTGHRRPSGRERSIFCLTRPVFRPGVRGRSASLSSQLGFHPAYVRRFPCGQCGCGWTRHRDLGTTFRMRVFACLAHLLSCALISLAWGGGRLAAQDARATHRAGPSGPVQRDGHRDGLAPLRRVSARCATARPATPWRAPISGAGSFAGPCPTRTSRASSRSAFPTPACRGSSCSRPRSTAWSRSSAPASTSAARRSRSAMPAAGRRSSRARAAAAPAIASTARARASRPT